MNEREQALADVSAALPILGKINDLYLAANSIYQKNMVKETKSARSKGRSGRIYGCIACGVTWYVLDLLFRLFIARLGSNVIAFIYIVFAIVACVAAYRKVKRRFESAPAIKPAEEAQNNQQLDAISHEIYQLTVQNQEAIAKMPRDYRYYDAVAFFENALANGRADSMKEAINLYEEYIHRQNMELNGRQMLEQSRMQSAMLANIEQSSREAAINSGIAATFSILNYLS